MDADSGRTTPADPAAEPAHGVTPATTDDGSLTLYTPRFGQTFHSRRGAVSESRHVFVAGSGVAGRLAAGLATRVLEVGFGSGLNFLLTADAALRGGAPLHYSALERDLLPADVIERLGYRAHLADPTPLDALLDFRRRLPARVAPGASVLRWRGGALELLIGDAAHRPLPARAFDAVYQDAFSPDANPELWSETFLAGLARTLAPGGTLVSYCVKGVVRRRLAGLGFAVDKRPGPPGGKREMLVATRPPGPPSG